jgi:hypothetical protein
MYLAASSCLTRSCCCQCSTSRLLRSCIRLAPHLPDWRSGYSDNLRELHRCRRLRLRDSFREHRHARHNRSLWNMANRLRHGCRRCGRSAARLDSQRTPSKETTAHPTRSGRRNRCRSDSACSPGRHFRAHRRGTHRSRTVCSDSRPGHRTFARSLLSNTCPACNAAPSCSPHHPRNSRHAHHSHMSQCWSPRRADRSPKRSGRRLCTGPTFVHRHKSGRCTGDTCTASPRSRPRRSFRPNSCRG